MSVKISQLSASSDITSDDFFPVVDSGSLTTKRASAQQMLDYVTGSTFDTLTVTTLDGTTAQFTIITGSTVTGSTALFSNMTASTALFSGDIRVLGTASITQLNTIGQQSLVIGDKYITILSGGVDHTGINGSGFLWGTSSGTGETTGALGEHAHVLYDASRDALEIFPGLYVTGSTTVFGISGTTAQFTTVSSSNLVVSGGNAIFYQSAVIDDNAYILYDPSIDKLAIFPGLYVTGAITASTVVAAPTGIFTTLSGSSGNITIPSSLSGMRAALTSSVTNYVLVAADSGKVVVLSSSSGITASIPTGLPVGFTTTIVQNGSGSIFVSASSGVVIRNRQNHTRTAGLYATVAIIGTGSDSYIFAGDTTS
jgi:hypothetical protein